MPSQYPKGQKFGTLSSVQNRMCDSLWAYIITVTSQTNKLQAYIAKVFFKLAAREESYEHINLSISYLIHIL